MANGFILDSSALIEAHRRYYAFDIAESFWAKLEPVIITDKVILLDVVLSEIYINEDKLTAWLKSIEGLSPKTVRDDGIISEYSNVLEFVRCSDNYNDTAFNSWADRKVADPWIIAAAKVLDATIVTNETPSGVLRTKDKTKTVYIPDIALYYDLKCINTFDFMRQVGIKL